MEIDKIPNEEYIDEYFSKMDDLDFIQTLRLLKIEVLSFTIFDNNRPKRKKYKKKDEWIKAVKFWYIFSESDYINKRILEWRSTLSKSKNGSLV